MKAINVITYKDNGEYYGLFQFANGMASEKRYLDEKYLKVMKELYQEVQNPDHGSFSSYNLISGRYDYWIFKEYKTYTFKIYKRGKDKNRLIEKVIIPNPDCVMSECPLSEYL